MSTKNVIPDLLDKKKTIGVIGLGYVGLPLALAFGKKFKVVGFDISSPKVQSFKSAHDPSGEMTAEDFEGNDIFFTDDINDLSSCHIYIVTVPTPVDERKVPDLSFVLKASAIIGKVIEKGDFVIYESTVYPGCTEEDCIPVIEEVSGLIGGRDFSFGYSPERINPGDKQHSMTAITKVVSGCDEDTLKIISELYASIVKGGVYKAQSIKIAEAAKLVENIQRDLNISLVNELSIIFDKMNIPTKDVLDAAASKWNFAKYTPGLVGGHCIAVDPYYLTYKSKLLGYDPQVILSGRRVNNDMPSYIAKKTIQLLLKNGFELSKSNVLVLGLTFKENVRDIRNSKVIELIKELKEYTINVDVYDPLLNLEENEYLKDLSQLRANYEGIIIAVPHEKVLSIFNNTNIKQILEKKGVIIDIKSKYKSIEFASDFTYWSL